MSTSIILIITDRRLHWTIKALFSIELNKASNRAFLLSTFSWQLHFCFLLRPGFFMPFHISQVQFLGWRFHHPSPPAFSAYWSPMQSVPVWHAPCHVWFRRSAWYIRSVLLSACFHFQMVVFHIHHAVSGVEFGNLRKWRKVKKTDMYGRCNVKIIGAGNKIFTKIDWRTSIEKTQRDVKE